LIHNFLTRIVQIIDRTPKSIKTPINPELHYNRQIENYKGERLKIAVITVGPIDENCHIIYCETHKTAIIVDPGDSPKRIIKFLEDHGLKPGMILNTHCHADHTGAAAKLVEHFKIPFHCHADDVWMLENHHQHEMAKYMGLGLPPKNDGTVYDGEEVDLCDDYSVQIIHTPGHTPGGICLLAGENVITGDTLFRGSIGRSDLEGGNHTQLVKSIKDKLLTLPKNTIVYPGHGDATTIGYEIDHNPFLRQTEGYN
jgi:hydroxyacylglutathione hydrolase